MARSSYCKNCERRFVGCKTGCEDYATERIVNAMLDARIRRNRRIDIDYSMRVVRSVDKTMRINSRGKGTKRAIGQL